MNSTTDKTTLKNVSGVPAPFLLLNNGRPDIRPIEQSNIFSRLRSFIPEFAEANRNLENTENIDSSIKIERVAQMEDSSTDSDSDSNSSTDSECEAEDIADSGCVQIDVNLFKDPEPIEECDPSIQDVVDVPEAFREDQNTSNSNNSKSKKVIEEIS